MATLKSTLRIDSSDLFPSPISFTVINNNTIDGSFSGFQTIDVNTTQQKLNIAAINGSALAAYCYFSNSTSSASTVFVGRTGQEAFLSLAPGDVSLISYGGTGTAGDLYAYTATGTGILSFFIGEKD